MKAKQTKIKVVSGSARVNHAHIMAAGDGCALIAVDMDSKRCEIDATGGGDEDGPSIYIGANRESLGINKELADTPTSVYFTEFKGWSVFCAEISRYTAYVALLK